MADDFQEDPTGGQEPKYKDYAWLDWLHQAYGPSKTRTGEGAGAYSDLPAGTSLQDVVGRYNLETGAKARYLGGPSGDQVDFGRGAEDVLTSQGQLWQANDPRGNNPRGSPTNFTGYRPSGGPGGGAPSMPYSPTPFTMDPLKQWDPGADLVQQPGGQDLAMPGKYQPYAHRQGVLGPQSAIDVAGRQGILDLMARSQPGPIDVHADANLAPQSAAYSDARNRAATQQRSALAERATASGLNSGGAGSGSFNTGLNSIYSSAGRDIAGNDAGLVGNEVAARRADLTNALSMANAVGARDEANQIQMELANLDNDYRYAGLNQTGDLATQRLGLDTGIANQNNSNTRADLGLRTGIANQNNRFNYAQLGQQGQLTQQGIGAENWRSSENNALSRYLGDQNNALGWGNVGLGQGNLDLGNRRLEQDTSQWNDQYGLDKSKFLSELDRDAMLKALLGQ